MEIVRKSFNKRLKRATVKVREEIGSAGSYQTHTVRIEPLYDSFIQYGAPERVLWKTLSIAEKLVKNKFKGI